MTEAPTPSITCDECGGIVVEQATPFHLHGELLGHFPAEVCQHCGEKVYSEDTADQIDVLAKEKGLWNLTSRTKVAAIGTTLGVTFSKRLIDFINLQKGKEVLITPENKKKFVIEFLD